MNAENPTRAIGRHVYGLGVMAMALLCLTWGDFILGQPVPKTFPARTLFAYVAASLMLVGGAAVQLRRTRARGAALLAAYYLVVVVLLMNGRAMVLHYAAYGAYSGEAEQVAILSAALLLYAGRAEMDPARAARLTRVARLAFGVCALLFGGAHFVYMDLTAPLVPRWLPLGQVFWGYATGVAFVAGGAALLSGVRARLAAILLTAMIGSFSILVHVPMLFTEPSSHMNWTEAAVNLAICGAAWVLADSLAPPR